MDLYANEKVDLGGAFQMTKKKLKKARKLSATKNLGSYGTIKWTYTQ
jgi:hypothetical protein